MKPPRKQILPNQKQNGNTNKAAEKANHIKFISKIQMDLENDNCIN